jgi:hypothetical protein
MADHFLISIPPGVIPLSKHNVKLYRIYYQEVPCNITLSRFLSGAIGYPREFEFLDENVNKSRLRGQLSLIGASIR